MNKIKKNKNYIGILFLIKQNFLLESRTPVIAYSFIVNLLSSCFLFYFFLHLSNNDNPKISIVLFWILLLFNANFALLKCFEREQRTCYLFYYQLVSSHQLLLSKLVYNFIVLSFLALVEYILFILFFESFILQPFLFFSTLFITCIGIVGIGSLTSAMAQKSIQKELLMGVLSFPLLLPLFSLCIKISQKCLLEEIRWGFFSADFLSLLSLDILIYTLVFSLFSLLWGD